MIARRTLYNVVRSPPPAAAVLFTSTVTNDFTERERTPNNGLFAIAAKAA